VNKIFRRKSRFSFIEKINFAPCKIELIESNRKLIFLFPLLWMGLTVITYPFSIIFVIPI
jgi:hypothetical protein